MAAGIYCLIMLSLATKLKATKIIFRFSDNTIDRYLPKEVKKLSLSDSWASFNSQSSLYPRHPHRIRHILLPASSSRTKSCEKQIGEKIQLDFPDRNDICRIPVKSDMTLRKESQWTSTEENRWKRRIESNEWKKKGSTKGRKDAAKALQKVQSFIACADRTKVFATFSDEVFVKPKVHDQDKTICVTH